MTTMERERDDRKTKRGFRGDALQRAGLVQISPGHWGRPNGSTPAPVAGASNGGGEAATATAATAAAASTAGAGPSGAPARASGNMVSGGSRTVALECELVDGVSVPKAILSAPFGAELSGMWRQAHAEASGEGGGGTVAAAAYGTAAAAYGAGASAGAAVSAGGAAAPLAVRKVVPAIEGLGLVAARGDGGGEAAQKQAKKDKKAKKKKKKQQQLQQQTPKKEKAPLAELQQQVPGVRVGCGSDGGGSDGGGGERGAVSEVEEEAAAVAERGLVLVADDDVDDGGGGGGGGDGAELESVQSDVDDEAAGAGLGRDLRRAASPPPVSPPQQQQQQQQQPAPAPAPASLHLEYELERVHRLLAEEYSSSPFSAGTRQAAQMTEADPRQQLDLLRLALRPGGARHFRVVAYAFWALHFDTPARLFATAPFQHDALCVCCANALRDYHVADLDPVLKVLAVLARHPENKKAMLQYGVVGTTMARLRKYKGDKRLHLLTLAMLCALFWQ